MPEKGARPNVHPVQRRVLRALAALSTPLLPSYAPVASETALEEHQNEKSR